MPTPTYTPLANITLGSAQTSVSFSGISQDYRDLVLVVQNTPNRSPWIRFNGISTYTYSYVLAWGSGSTASSGGAATDDRLWLTQDISTTSIVNIMDYSATDKHKSVLSRSGNAGGYLQMHTGRWASTSAITSFIFQAGSGTFDAGSTFALYGIAA